MQSEDARRSSAHLEADAFDLALKGGDERIGHGSDAILCRRRRHVVEVCCFLIQTDGRFKRLYNFNIYHSGNVMLSSPRPLKVFLCHAHSDATAVRALYDRLTQDGVDAWLDKKKLLPGADWELDIRKAVREADLVVVCLSKQFNQAGFRQKEVRLALEVAIEKPEGDIFIIPAKLEECEVLDNLKKWQWVNLFEDDGYERLTQTLDLRAERIGALYTKRSKGEPEVSELREYPLNGQVGALNSTALTYDHAGDLDTALNYFQQALDLAKTINDKRMQAVVSSNVGRVHWRMGMFDTAREYFEQSLQLSLELGDTQTEASVLTSLGHISESIGDLVRAAELFERALLINKQLGL